MTTQSLTLFSHDSSTHHSNTTSTSPTSTDNTTDQMHQRKMKSPLFTINNTNNRISTSTTSQNKESMLSTPPLTPTNQPSSLLCLSRFITAVLHQLLGRLPSGMTPASLNNNINNINNQINSSHSNNAYEKQVRDIYAIIQQADKGGGVTGPTLITAMALIHRVIESREIDTLSAIMHRERNTHLPSCGNCVKTMQQKYPRAWDAYRASFESRYPSGTSLNHLASSSASSASQGHVNSEDGIISWNDRFTPLKPKEHTKHICITQDGFQGLETGSESILFAVSMMIAHKSTEDWAYHAKGWSKFSGIPKERLVKLEREFLSILRYDVFMSSGFFNEWVEYVTKLAVAWNCTLFAEASVWKLPPSQSPSNSIKSVVVVAVDRKDGVGQDTKGSIAGSLSDEKARHHSISPMTSSTYSDIIPNNSNNSDHLNVHSISSNNSGGHSSSSSGNGMKSRLMKPIDLVVSSLTGK